ncbi:MAG: orotate phosphoribosyltransferase [Clostridiales bacterium]|nr:orotate phosphoribosyltransferase [Clostridiales bacterium]
MDRTQELLKESGALLHGHFLLSSGKHSDGYVQCAKLLMHPERAAEAVGVIADKLRRAGVQADMVCGPAMGGIVIAYELGRQLGVPAIFTERENGEMTLRRGFEVREGQRILIAEDVVTTGKSSMESARALESKGAKVIGIACLVDRSEAGTVSVPIYSSTQIRINTYDADTCPLCRSDEPLVKPGSRNLTPSAGCRDLYI